MLILPRVLHDTIIHSIKFEEGVLVYLVLFLSFQDLKNLPTVYPLKPRLNPVFTDTVYQNGTLYTIYMQVIFELSEWEQIFVDGNQKSLSKYDTFVFNPW